MKRIIALALVVAAAPAFAADETPAKAATCFACHGEAGAKPITPAYPVLAGQYANYLEHALLEYKAGTRKNAIMGGQVAALTAQDLKQLARYFASQPSPLYTPTVHGKTHAPGAAPQP